MGDVPLTHGWLPWVVLVAAPVALVLGVAWRHGAWRRQLLWGLGVSLASVGAVALANRVLDAFPYSFPPSFYLYAGLVVFALTMAVAGFSAPGNWRRIDSVVAVVLCAALVGVVVNDHYDYYPKLGNLFGRVTGNEVELPELAAIRSRARSTGQLPDKGATVHVPIPGTTSRFDARDGYVYLPPAYFADPPPDLPVLVLVHGVPGDPSDWLVGGQAASVLDAFAASHGGKAPIVVMPDATGSDLNDTECVDGGHGQVYTYLTTDVPTFVETTFPSTKGSHWGVAGLSMGGYCSLMISLRDSSRFTVFGDYSGLDRPELDPPADALTDLFGGDQQKMDSYDPRKLLPGHRFPQLSGWFETGLQDDAPLAATRAIVPLADAAGITTCTLQRDGGHDFDFWHGALEHSLPWMSGRLGLVDPPVDTYGATCT